MDPFTIAALVAAVAGAAVQQKAQSDASSRQRQQVQQSLQSQQAYQREAENAAAQKAQEFAPEVRQDKQAAAEQAITDTLIAPVNQAAATTAATDSKAQGNVSGDYLAARASSQAEQLKSAQALASLFGKTTGANRLRQDEAIGMADTGNLIDRIGSFAKGGLAADQYGIQSAGTPDGGAMLLGTGLQVGGSIGAASSAASAAAAAAKAKNFTGPSTSWIGTTSGLSRPTTSPW